MSHPRIYKVEGIIIKRRNVSEADRILTVFTQNEGKIKLLAKGVRKINSRRSPHLEVFSQVKLVLHQAKNLDLISEVSPVKQLEIKDLEKIGVAYFFCELIDALLPEKQEHADVYQLFVNHLNLLSVQNSPEIYHSSRDFVLELLWRLGFLPKTQRLSGSKLQNFVESIVEKNLRTPKLIRQVFS